MKFTIVSSSGCGELLGDVGVEFVVVVAVGDGEGMLGGEFVGEFGVKPGSTSGQGSLVGPAEQAGDDAPVGGGVVAVGSLDSFDQVFAFESSEVVGRLA